MSEENAFLAAAADDMMLLGSVAQNIASAADEEAVFEPLVHHLGLVKGFAYCAIASWIDDEMYVCHDYAHEWEGTQQGMAHAIDESWYELLDGRLDLLATPDEAPWPNLLAPIEEETPISQILVGVIRRRRQPYRLLVCASSDPIDRGRLAPVLERLREVVESRLDVLDLLEEVRMLNEVLSHTVTTRENQLQAEAWERSQVEQLRRHDAVHDELTGLLNRRGFLNSLGSLVFSREGATSSFALMVLDVDRFKLINEGLGPELGDYVLVQLARRLKENTPPTSLLARLGADEFAVVFPAIRSRILAKRAASHLQQALAAPYDVAGREVFARTSIGVVLSGDYERAEELMRDANAALAGAKKAGEERIEFYDMEMRLQVVEQLSLETSLRRATEKGELFVEYQPLIDLASGQLSSFEALVRWQHPERGRVSPVEFIPLAEQTGLIIDIGAWVLEQACRQSAAWRKTHAIDVSIGVNASAKQLAHPQFVDEVQNALARTGLDSAGLKIEMTESALLDQADASRDRLQRIRELGVTLCMDDFGTGYSSLTYLHQFPFDIIKIDRSFVTPLTSREENAAIVKTIIDMAHTLGKRVVAEGIETEAQLDVLRMLGCDLGQGYFFARPLSMDDAAALMAADRKW